jgi:hypothetical protein
VSDVPETELAREIEAELARLSVADVLLHAAGTVASLGYRRLEPEHRDLDQVRLAIESLQAVLPQLEGHASSDVLQDFRQVVASLQLGYADAAR